MQAGFVIPAEKCIVDPEMMWNRATMIIKSIKHVPSRELNRVGFCLERDNWWVDMKYDSSACKICNNIK